MPIHFSPEEMAGQRERAAAAIRNAGVFLTNGLTGWEPPAMRNTTSDDSTPARYATPCSREAGRMKPASSVAPADHSTTVGFTGRRNPACRLTRVPNTGRMRSTGSMGVRCAALAERLGGTAGVFQEHPGRRLPKLQPIVSARLIPRRRFVPEACRHYRNTAPRRGTGVTQPPRDRSSPPASAASTKPRAAAFRRAPTGSPDPWSH